MKYYRERAQNSTWYAFGKIREGGHWGKDWLWQQFLGGVWCEEVIPSEEVILSEEAESWAPF